jgi:hypothetical protein
MPTRSTAKKPAELPSVVDQMGEDAEGVEVPTEYPPGVPGLKPMLAIRPRSKRAEFKRRFAEVAEMRSLVEKAQAEAGKLKQGSDDRYAAELRLWAQMDDLFDKVNAALRIAATDEAEYDAWSDALEDDNDLMTTFSVYQSRTQPGEASSSTS